jgi:hypothetical protein
MITVWAETGDFRDNNHHGISTDHTSQLNFGSSRNRNRDRKGKYMRSKIHITRFYKAKEANICFNLFK